MKMSDGRKTRGKIGQKNEKAKLDKEWNQVYKYIYGEGPGEKEGTRGGGFRDNWVYTIITSYLKKLSL